MRKNVSLALQKPALRAFAVMLLASAAAGCSSDVSRFEGYLSSDSVTTGSINQKSNVVNANASAPPTSVGSASSLPIVASSDFNSPLNQPMPSANGSTGNIYDNIKTGTVVKRNTLSAPASVASGSQVMPQERPVQQTASAVEIADPIRTGSVPKKTEKKASTDVAMNKVPDVPLPKTAPEHNVAIVPQSAEWKNTPKKEAKADPGTGANGVYKVQPGDSLGKIAAEHGTNVASLMKANGLTSSNIRIGQTLKVPGGEIKVAKAEQASVVKADPVKTSSTPKEYDPPVKKVSVEQAEKTTDVATAAPDTTGIGKYRWPARGAIIANYGANVDGERNDGIDISLPEGTPVKAAENGVVIYSGDGLKKLGNTVLIRHADGKVTVYAHVKSLNVQRGEQVKRGQVIASSGMTGSASRPKLHFEVRKNSAPVNPITFLE